MTIHKQIVKKKVVKFFGTQCRYYENVFSSNIKN